MCTSHPNIRISGDHPTRFEENEGCFVETKRFFCRQQALLFKNQALLLRHKERFDFFIFI